VPRNSKKSEPQSPGVVAYFEALARQFQHQSEVLSRVLPHYGERGANDEERVRDFLRNALPKRFSIGTGFLVCSEPSLPPSRQTDVVIYDEIENAPLHQELVASVYPVEMVYGAIEVKGTLRSSDLKKILTDIDGIRELAKHRYYRDYFGEARYPDDPTRLVTKQREFKLAAPAPRTFVFAYSQDSWKTVDALVRSLTKASKRTSSHIHGLVILEDGWYVAQEAHASAGPTFHACTEDALMRFIAGVIHSVSSMDMLSAPIQY
jgi:hypothetical protein